MTYLGCISQFAPFFASIQRHDNMEAAPAGMMEHEAAVQSPSAGTPPAAGPMEEGTGFVLRRTGEAPTPVATLGKRTYGEERHWDPAAAAGVQGADGQAQCVKLMRTSMLFADLRREVDDVLHWR